MTAKRRVQIVPAGISIPAFLGMFSALLCGCWGGPGIGPQIGSAGRNIAPAKSTAAALPQGATAMAGSGADLDVPDAGMGDEPSAPVDSPQPPEPRPAPAFADDSARCGNGVLDDTELCDIAIKAGEPGACPTTCDDSDPCNPTALEVSGCMSRCVPVDPGADCEMQSN